MAPSQPSTSTSTTLAPPALLTKFILHPSSVCGPSSLIATWLSSHPSPSHEDLVSLRSQLQLARDGAEQRLAIKDANKVILVQRQVRDKQLVEEQARLKDAERRRKREEDELRRERERQEREREQTETERKEREEQGDVPAVEDEEDDDSDVQMEDVKLEPKVEDEGDITSTPVVTLQSSPEPEEDGQPRPPKHKLADQKKRKREQVVDTDDGSSSDDEVEVPLSQKATKNQHTKSHASAALPHRATPSGSRQASLAPSVSVALPEPPQIADPLDGLTPLERKLREDRFTKHSIPIKAPAAGAAVNFHLPPQTLVPIKPPSIPPPSTAKKQSEVAEDFSKAKPGTQIAFNTFHTWAENYLRPFGEDDLAFLAPTPHDPGLYAMPALGKHYLEKWDEEDADVPHSAAGQAQYSALEPPTLTRFRPDAINEDALAAENVFLGPLSERLVAAMVFEEGGDPSELEEQVEDEEDEDGGGGPPPTKVLDAVELEDRIKKELRFIGILSEEEVQWAAREDDEVSSALRSCQRLLHRQSGINEARKAILSEIVKDRMGYQEYEATRDAQERVIEQGWQKRQRSGKKKGKGNKDKAQPEGATTTNKTPVSIALLQAVEKRGRLVGKFKSFFEDEEDRERWMGMPSQSVFEGLDGDDVPMD